MAKGRPAIYSDALADKVCARIAGGESLVKVCGKDGIPSTTTVFKWLEERPEFADKYARARELQAEYYAHQIIDIADETPIREQPDPDGGVTMCVDAAGVQRNKLRVDARKWYASKVAPKKYGEKVQAELSGPDGGPIPVSLEIDL